jgi:chromosome partitioning related protein ParA
MKVVSIISTKSGVGKTTTAANLGGSIADAGLRVLLVDLDVQPTLSSYFTLVKRAAGDTYGFTSRVEPRGGERYDAC